ncbi:antibiotic biosynthesis monooxygenase [Myxococcota bacterium]|nr:antibiotic biosynthesis monooxygenase [Myxococcota bacterium]
MVTIGMNYQVLAGKEETFEAACQRVLEAMKDAAGHDHSAVYRRVDPCAAADYLIVSRWNDEAAFQSFLASEAFQKVTRWGLANILAGRPSHTTYRED